MTEKIKATYKVRNIDIKHHDQVYPEGSTIELDGDAAGALSKWLEPIADEVKPPAKKDGGAKTSKDSAPQGNSDNKDKA